MTTLHQVASWPLVPTCSQSLRWLISSALIILYQASISERSLGESVLLMHAGITSSQKGAIIAFSYPA